MHGRDLTRLHAVTSRPSKPALLHRDAQRTRLSGIHYALGACLHRRPGALTAGSSAPSRRVLLLPSTLYAEDRASNRTPTTASAPDYCCDKIPTSYNRASSRHSPNLL